MRPQKAAFNHPPPLSKSNLGEKSKPRLLFIKTIRCTTRLLERAPPPLLECLLELAILTLK